MDYIEYNNFANVRKHLDFQSADDRYVISIMCRTKDLPTNHPMLFLGSNQTQRIIKTYYIDSLDYFDLKKDAIKALCKSNMARAYILPQVRSYQNCMIELGKYVMDGIKTSQGNPNSMVQRAFASYHSSRAPRWVVDVDFLPSAFDSFEITEHLESLVVIREFLEERLKECGKDVNDLWFNDSINGGHFITPKFDRRKFPELQKSLFDKGFTHVSVDLKPDNFTLLYFAKCVDN